MAPTEDTDFNTSTKASKQKAFEVNMKSVHASCRGMGHSGLQNIFVTKQLTSSLGYRRLYNGVGRKHQFITHGTKLLLLTILHTFLYSSNYQHS